MAEKQFIPLKMRKARSIESIYERVKDFDIVLSVDAPLNDALCVRWGGARLGYFATTPKRWALGNYHMEKLESDRALFLRIINSEKIHWKMASYLMENIISCWRETGDPRSILHYNEYNTPISAKILDLMMSAANQYSVMMMSRLPEGKSVAVIGLEQFQELDKLILPDNFEKVTLFEDEWIELPPFGIFGTTRDIVQAVVGSLTECITSDAAVVAKEGSRYMHLVESALRARNVPIMRKEKLADLEDLRTFLALLRLAGRRGIRVKEVSPILLHLGKALPRTHRSMFVSPLDLADLDDIKNKLSTMNEMTFHEALEEFEEWLDVYMGELRAVIEEIGFLNEITSKRNLDSIEFYLNAYEQSRDKPSRGVLLASPNTSGFIDRPLIFYMGMDSSWTPRADNRPWVDKKERDNRNLRNFQLLLQNGASQQYMVKDSYMGERIVPCHYFSEFTSDSFKSFSELESVKYKIRSKKNACGNRPVFKKEQYDVTSTTYPVKTLSQSGLNVLAFSPKDYFFSRLVEGEDKLYFQRGNLLHDFAEFYLNFPHFVKEMGPDEFIDIMVNLMEPYVDRLTLSQYRTQFTVAVENLITFIDTNLDLSGVSVKGFEKRAQTNTFSKHFNKAVHSNFTEMNFYNRGLGSNGKVDLIPSSQWIVDYKTGRKKSIGEIIRGSDVVAISKKPDFQIRMYLSHLRSIYPGRLLKFTFCHLLENIDGSLAGGGDMKDNLISVKYFPFNFHQVVPERDVFEWLKSSKARRELLDKLGFEGYNTFFSQNSMPDCGEEELSCHVITKAFENFCVDMAGDTKKVRNSSYSVLKFLLRFRNAHLFVEDLNAFDAFLKEQLEMLNRYMAEGFPVGAVDLDEIENKDLVIRYG